VRQVRRRRRAHSYARCVSGPSARPLTACAQGRTPSWTHCLYAGSYAFVDTDSTLEQAMNATVAQFFEKEGEESFRKAESMILNQVS
jgi:hypothetical protein